MSRRFWAQHVACVWPSCCDVLRHVGCCWLNFDHFQICANYTQHVATHRNTVAKRAQHAAPNSVATCSIGMLWSFGRNCKCWANNVGIGCVEMLRSFGRGFTIVEGATQTKKRCRLNKRKDTRIRGALSRRSPRLIRQGCSSAILKRYTSIIASNICKLQSNNRNVSAQLYRNMLRAFGHPVATCCDMLGIENAQAQHCCTNMSKRLQHHATSTNVAWKLLPVSNLKPWPNDSNLSSMLREFGHLVATCCAMLRGVGWCWPKF